MNYTGREMYLYLQYALCCMPELLPFNLVPTGELFSSPEAFGCQDKRDRETRESVKADEGRNPDAQHRIYVHRGSSRRCEE